MSARYPADTQNALSIDDGPSPAWWASPDIWVGPEGGPGNEAHEGLNTVSVRVHRAKSKEITGKAVIELFVGNPNLVMSPVTPASALRIADAVVPVSAIDPNSPGHVELMKWTVTVNPMNPDGADQPGHRCLIARVYPTGDIGPSDFQVPTDSHEAQRNINIIAAAKTGPGFAGTGGGMNGTLRGEPIGPGPDGLWEFRLQTTSTDPERPSKVTARVDTARTLPQLAFGQLTPALREMGMKGYALEPPPLVQLSVAQDGQWNPSKPGVDGAPAELRLEVQPRQVTDLAVKVDLSRTEPGMIQVVHVRQLGPRRRAEGGITLLFARRR